MPLLIHFVVSVGLIAGGGVSVEHDFAGNDWFNPVVAKTYQVEALIVALFSGFGLLAQCISVNMLYIQDAKKRQV